MRRSHILLIGLLALALGACGGNHQTTDEFVAATPDVDGLTLEIGDDSIVHPMLDAGSSLEDQTIPAVIAPCEPYMYLCRIHEAVGGINTYLRAAIAPIEALAQTTPTEVSPTIRVYGPVDAPLAPATPVASFRLTVKKGLLWFYWKLEGKPLNAADSEYLLVASGAIRRTADDWIHRGRGFLGFDLDRLYTLNPSSGTPIWPGKGKLFAGFGHLGGAKALVYVLENFTPNGILPVQNAVMLGWKKANGVARVRVASLNDFVAGNSGGGAETVDELLLSRAIWIPGLGGRAVVAVGNGDVPSYGYDFFLGISCYDVSEHDVYRALYGCKDQVCTTVIVPGVPEFNTGDPALCAPGSDLGVGPSNPPANPQTELTDQTMEPGGPEVVPEPPPTELIDFTVGS